MLYEILKARAMGAGAVDDMLTALFAQAVKTSTCEFLEDSEGYQLQDSEDYDLYV